MESDESTSQLGMKDADATPHSFQIHRRISTHLVLEFSLWSVFAVIASGRIWLQILSFPGIRRDILINAFYFDIVLASLVLVFPYCYKLIFGMLPLQHVRYRRQTHHSASGAVGAEERTSSFEVADSVHNALIESADAHPVLAHLAGESRRLATNLYTRSGVYLIIGVLVAFSGLLFFYLQTASSKSSEASLVSQISVLAPRFGILFFIEFIAFFFLRQYQSAMEEFRYYEAIKRQREETMALLAMLKPEERERHLLDLVKQGVFYSSAGKLSAGETTEIIESKKLTKDEMVIFEKIIEALGRSK